MLTGSFFQLFDYAYYLASLLRTLPRLGGGARVPAEHSSFSKPALQYITMCDQTKTGHSLLSLTILIIRIRTLEMFRPCSRSSKGGS